MKTCDTYYSMHHWSPDEEVDFHRTPKNFLTYQYDCIGNTHYSVIHSRDVGPLIYHSERGNPMNAYALLNLNDTQIQAATAFLKLAFGDISANSSEFEDLSFVAFTQLYGIGNRKLAKLIFSRLLAEGNSIKDITESLINGAYPEIDDGEYPQLPKTLASLEKKNKPKENLQ